MKLDFDRVVILSDHDDAVLVTTNGEPGVSMAWSVANRADVPVHVRSVSLVWRVVDVAGPLRMFRNGYQSWSATGVATFGVDRDPSCAPGQIDLFRHMHHADPEIAEPGELRSELVTVFADAGGVPPIVAGFLGGSEHDGTFRLRDRDGSVELWAEAFLGGVQLQPGESRELHPIRVWDADEDPSVGLGTWASAFGAAVGARTTAPYKVGWCSWYHYFGNVTEDDIRSNLAAARNESWPFDVFQIDDGYQADIGDWLTTNDKFPSTLDNLASAISAEGRRPGLWLAPFFAGPGSAVANANPDWLARAVDGDSPLIGHMIPNWGGAAHVLDTTNPAVLAHLESVADQLVDAGFSYLKLDFTYGPMLPGVFADPTKTPAQRVRAGFEAVRRGAGDEAFLVGCGAPLGPAVGLVDAMRISPDVAPHWPVPSAGWEPPGYADTMPATVSAFRNTLTRSFMHRKLWLNDPDCLMLRTEQTELSPEAALAWAHAVGVSGGMALVSDDLSLLGPDARAVLDEVIEIGRAADDSARAGEPARCEDLLDSPWPGRLSAAGVTFVGDPAAGTAALSR